MKLVERWLAGIFHTLNLLTFSPSGGEHVIQQPLGYQSLADYGSGPIFHPPNSGAGFQCNYSVGQPRWKECSTPQNRGCWLRGPKGDEFNITTDYENFAPVGIVRTYELEVSEEELDPDGFRFIHGKVFNKQYPGPWIQACWGDQIEVKVTNRLKHNGTTIHWHGIRQNGTLDMDGVNGVTQCPISTNDSFTYKFNTTQYGSSWYHSHYSLQYADGLLGPMTIHGPSSANYDEAKEPILMTDWNHRSAFEDFFAEMTGNKPTMTSSLMNGRGYYECTVSEREAGNCTTPAKKYTAPVQEGKKYLLRLINTSVDSTWIFSIDNHEIEVIGSDFVPIKPYRTNHVLVGIGQRYHVAVEATRPLTDSDYWIRMRVANGCSGFARGYIPEERLGVLRYNDSSDSDPITTENSYGMDCADELYDRLVPILPWKVGKPANERT